MVAQSLKGLHSLFSFSLCFVEQTGLVTKENEKHRKKKKADNEGKVVWKKKVGFVFFSSSVLFDPLQSLFVSTGDV